MRKNSASNKKLRVVILFFILLWMLLFGFWLKNYSANRVLAPVIVETNISIYAEVLYVIDGDTVDVSINGKKQRVRLLGIDAPEMGFENKKEMCFAKESRNKLVQLIDRKTVNIASDSTQQDRDVYNRILRYIYLPDGTFVNTQMIEEGYAYEYTYKELPYRYRQEFQESQRNAQALRVGLWKEGVCP